LKAPLFGRGVRCALLTALLCIPGQFILAQQDDQGPPSAPEPQVRSKAAGTVKAGEGFVELLTRKSVVFPALAANSSRLSPRQKFQLAANNSVALSRVAAIAITAGFNQEVDVPPGWEQGMSGYGKRFGSGLARSTSTQMFGTFALASALHQDPRFYFKPNLTIRQSVVYAIDRVLFTRADNGTQELNWSGLLAPLATEALANTYQPSGDNGTGDAFRRYGYDLVWTAVGNLAKQYWPKVNKRLRRPPTQNGKP
jgi:hypothetical protein